MLLDSPTVMGIERIGVGFLQLRFVARTLPGKQWEVGRELRGRIAEAFRGAGIAAPRPAVVNDPPSDEGSAPHVDAGALGRLRPHARPVPGRPADSTSAHGARPGSARARHHHDHAGHDRRLAADFLDDIDDHARRRIDEPEHVLDDADEPDEPSVRAHECATEHRLDVHDRALKGAGRERRRGGRDSGAAHSGARCDKRTSCGRKQRPFRPLRAGGVLPTVEPRDPQYLGGGCHGKP